MTRDVLTAVENHLRQYRKLQRRQDREARAWCDAVRETLSAAPASASEEYETGGEPMKARLLVLRYFDGLTEESVMDFINASRNTYYAWKKDVLDTVAFHAAQKGLL